MASDEETPSSVAEEDPELLLSKKKNKEMDQELCTFIQRAIFTIATLAICCYFMITCDACLLVIMMTSACCCTANQYFALPFMTSLLLYAISHQQTIRQAFTIGEDIYTFNEKYK